MNFSALAILGLSPFVLCAPASNTPLSQYLYQEPPLQYQPLQPTPLEYQSLKPSPLGYQSLLPPPLSHQPLKPSHLQVEPLQAHPVKPSGPLLGGFGASRSFATPGQNSVVSSAKKIDPVVAVQNQPREKNQGLLAPSAIPKQPSLPSPSMPVVSSVKARDSVLPPASNQPRLKKEQVLPTPKSLISAPSSDSPIRSVQSIPPKTRQVAIGAPGFVSDGPHDDSQGHVHVIVLPHLPDGIVVTQDWTGKPPPQEPPSGADAFELIQNAVDQLTYVLFHFIQHLEPISKQLGIRKSEIYRRVMSHNGFDGMDMSSPFVKVAARQILALENNALIARNDLQRLVTQKHVPGSSGSEYSSSIHEALDSLKANLDYFKRF